MTSNLFGIVFGQSQDPKAAIFGPTFNPQAAICLTKVYSTFLMLTRGNLLTQQRIVLGLAINDCLLWKLIKFLSTYGGLKTLLTRDDREIDSDHLE